MSSENDSKLDMVKNIGSSIMALRTDNPKMFYGGAVVIFIVILFLFVSGGPSDAPQMKMSLVKGQTYIIKSPNGGKVLLLAKPMMGSSEYTEDINVCLVEPGTPAKFEDQTLVSFIHFVQVSPSSGDCNGKTGWTSKINISQ